MRQSLAWRIGVILAAVAACAGEQTGPESQRPPSEPIWLVGSAALAVQLSTAGIAPGVPTFSVAVDGVDSAAPTTGTLALRVKAGAHTILLHDIPRHCQIPLSSALPERAWSEGRQIVAPSGQTTTVRFEVICSETGTLRIETSTSGYGPGLLIGILTGHPRWLFELPPNGTEILDDVFVGAHEVSVSGPPGCVGSKTRVPVQISANTETIVRFGFACW
jgi:hypothetical protein